MNDPHSESPHNVKPRRFFAPWEHAFDRVLTPFEAFIHNQTTGGIMLLISAVVALLFANSPWGAAYHHLLEARVQISLGGFVLNKSLHHWINDGLMTLFFFLVGMEIKREVLVGELSSLRQASLPIVAAIGGMAAPALVYVLVAGGPEFVQGWGIPTATDIAFAVAALVLLGRRIPGPLMTFLVALAIVDDIGAVIVIAVFYTDQISTTYLALSAALLVTLIAFNLGGIRRPLPYFILGTLLWLAMLKSGVHATLAGVLLAFTIPAHPKFDPDDFANKQKHLLDRFDDARIKTGPLLSSPQQQAILETIEDNAAGMQTPLQRLEGGLHLPVALLVMPLFALANAGLSLDPAAVRLALSHPVTLAVAAGLVIGKPLGIVGSTWLAIKLGLGRLPEGVLMRHVIGVSMLAGIGFTMSIFITDLAFSGNTELIELGKAGILFASCSAGLLGYLWLRFVPTPQRK
ncbi:MAG: Na+/H+ antiporter NhaA [Gammaproteobacteria bacterium]